MATRVINFYGGPSAGKSTLALEVTGILKRMRLNAEYVSEFPKDLTWRGAAAGLDDQLYVFGNQHHDMYVLKDQVDWIVTDGSFLLQLYYVEQANRKYYASAELANWIETFQSLIRQTAGFYENYHYFADRKNRKFVQAGRVQNESESREIDVQLKRILASEGVVPMDVSTPEEVIADLKERGLL